jgi:hypothetical protein
MHSKLLVRLREFGRSVSCQGFKTVSFKRGLVKELRLKLQQFNFMLPMAVLNLKVSQD